MTALDVLGTLPEKVARTPVGPLHGRVVTRLSRAPDPVTLVSRSGEMESFVVVVTWIRSRAAKRAEPEG
ncbi:MAG: hypothetical protein ACXWK4_12205, partial [Myxococcaceae bacterium]